jgi:hypothetical protein
MVGVSKDIAEREKKLNFDGYAGALDWEILFSMHVIEAGKVESAAHQALADFRKPTAYWKDRAFLQSSKESFSCAPMVAVDAILRAVDYFGAKHDKPVSNYFKLQLYSSG